MRYLALGILVLVAFAGALLLVTVRAGGRRTVPAGDAAVETEAAGSRPSGGDLDAILREANRGVALLDRHEFLPSVEAWRKVTSLAPDWPAAWVNLGIALLNHQKEPKECEEALKRAIALDAKNPWAHYTLSILYAWENRTDDRIAELRATLAIDPDDADSHYELGSALGLAAGAEGIAANEKERLRAEARASLEKAVALQPAHASAWYGLQQLRLRTGDREGALAASKRFLALKDSGGVMRSMKYTEMGRYAEVARLDGFGRPKPAPASVKFARVDPATLPFAAPGGDAAGWAIASGVALADLDGDGDLDAALAAAGARRGVAIHRNDAGKFGPAEPAVGPAFRCMGVYAGDFDNDGDVDLFATGAGENRLLRNAGGGTFEDATTAAGVKGENRWSVGASLTDLDQDGDLDIFVANLADLSGADVGAVDVTKFPGAPDALFVNKGDGTFEDAALRLGVDGGSAHTTGTLAADLDGDGDPDLVAFDEGQTRVYWNDRILRLRPADDDAPLRKANPSLGGVPWDPDRDGDLDLLLVRPSGIEGLRNDGHGRFAPDPKTTVAGGTTVALPLDVDNDGDDDLLFARGASGAADLRLLRNDGPGEFADASDSAGLTGGSVGAPCGGCAGDLDGDGDLDAIVATKEGTPLVLRNDGGNANRWIGIRLRGVRSGSELRSPAQGIGAVVEVKAGGLVSLRTLGGGSGFLGTEPDVLHFGLGDRPQADYVRILWPDGVIQAELDLPGGQVHAIEELQRKGSSCPVLFAWDGERFACVTDFLGVGGLGFLVSPGVYGPPDPDETVAIPFPLAPKDGMLELRIAEPLEEATYADAFSLVAWDVPEGVEVVPDERFAASPPLPTGEPIAFRERVRPIAARRDDGRDLLDAVLRTDRIYAGPAALEPRFLGYARPHALELDFGEAAAPLAKDGGRVFLVAWGWVEYPYSRINLGASQAGLRMEAPSIEVPHGAGGWKRAMPEFGYPAGLPRWMTVEVTDLVRAGHSRMRLATNCEVYWDELFLVRAGAAEVARTEVSPSTAELRACGYPREFSPDGAAPRLYDYAIRDRGFPFFRNLPGDYTRFGDCLELVREVDDRFAIFGKGEEIALRFDPAALPPLAPGRRRFFALRANGYCKDMDPCTGGGDAVEPLPFQAMSNYPFAPGEAHPDGPEHREYRERWNTRRVGARPPSR